MNNSNIIVFKFVLKVDSVVCIESRIFKICSKTAKKQVKLFIREVKYKDEKHIHETINNNITESLADRRPFRFYLLVHGWRQPI